MKLKELDNYFRKQLKINDEIKTMRVYQTYGKDGVIDLLIGICYSYNGKRSLTVMPTYTPNLETKKMDADFDNLKYKKFWLEDESCTEDEFVNSVKDLCSMKK